jgi:hypothetical protein
VAKRKATPVGRAIRWTAADIERLAEITPEDIASAKAQFNRLAPRKLRGLLDAKGKVRKG